MNINDQSSGAEPHSFLNGSGRLQIFFFIKERRRRLGLLVWNGYVRRKVKLLGVRERDFVYGALGKEEENNETSMPLGSFFSDL